mmetsp:Transcript_19878/g.63986  ORF Transcript_19878/g.63986 Transcript_19878/m.63986 type:complete len:710 (-) Transcript_19878:98-2227(-)
MWLARLVPCVILLSLGDGFVQVGVVQPRRSVSLHFGSFGGGSSSSPSSEEAEALALATSVLEADLGLGLSSKLSDDFLFVAPGRKPLTKRRYLANGYATSLRKAGSNVEVSVSDARFVEPVTPNNATVRVVATTRWSGCFDGRTPWTPPRWATSDGGKRETLAPNGATWVAGPFAATVDVDLGAMRVTEISEGRPLDRDSDDDCDGGVDAVYRAMGGSTANVAKAPGLATSELGRRFTSLRLPSLPFSELAKKKIVLNDGAAETLAKAAVNGLVLLNEEKKASSPDSAWFGLFAPDAVILGPSFAAGTPKAIAFRRPWPSAPVAKTLNWRLDDFGVVRFDVLLDSGRAEAGSATFDDQGQLSRLALGFRLDDRVVDRWTELPASLWAERAASSTTFDRAVDDLSATLDDAAETIGGLVPPTPTREKKTRVATPSSTMETMARAARENALDAAVAFATTSKTTKLPLEEKAARSSRERSLDDFFAAAPKIAAPPKIAAAPKKTPSSAKAPPAAKAPGPSFSFPSFQKSPPPKAAPKVVAKPKPTTKAKPAASVAKPKPKPAFSFIATKPATPKPAATPAPKPAPPTKPAPSKPAFSFPPLPSKPAPKTAPKVETKPAPKAEAKPAFSFAIAKPKAEAKPKAPEAKKPKVEAKPKAVATPKPTPRPAPVVAKKAPPPKRVDPRAVAAQAAVKAATERRQAEQARRKSPPKK